MVFWYRVLCVVVVTGYLVATARGYPVLNLFNYSVGAQKGASQFHK
jgi:hypothetical protein